MKYAVYEADEALEVGLLDEESGSLKRLNLTSEQAALGVLAVIELEQAGKPPEPDGVQRKLSEVRLLAPVPRPHRNIFCVGKNYHAHAEEFASSGFDSSAANGSVPKAPIIFSKVPESVSGPGAPIPLDERVTQAVDYEAELAVIIGRGGRAISKEQALEHVWGYTIVNDVTARDLQGRHSQWLIGKSQDGFCPMGPCAVRAEDFNLSDSLVTCRVNGEPRQEASTSQLIFDVPTLIETLSAGITLMPGDVIATGTPAGVGIGFDPPRYLKPGDVVEVEIEGIGVLKNSVCAYSDAKARTAAA